ncbi:MAG: hypothetical protein KAR06_04280 [Deltaproteobacteria bacterium]|nr:hypothetical protein [Deltaproteobacteria bacterium]
MSKAEQTPTWEDFEKKYTPDTSIKSDCLSDDNEGGLETFGADYEQVVAITKATPKRVWTVIDGEGDKLYVVAGWHWVDRVQYLITEEEWTDEHETYGY